MKKDATKDEAKKELRRIEQQIENGTFLPEGKVPNGAGEPITYRNMVQKQLLPGFRAAGLPRIRFHDLRHTNASLRLENGENIKYIQTQLEHASPTVTLNVYAHLMNPTNQEAACRLENSVLGESGSKMVAETKKGPRS
jgi:integrase